MIAKLDRLSRDAHFLLGLQKAGVRFIAADMPNANDLTVGIMALVAQEERRAISARTTAALATARARGVKLGGWKGGPKVDSSLRRKKLEETADTFAASIAPIVIMLRDAGHSLRQVGAELSVRGILTARGGQWTAAAVRAVLIRHRNADLI